MGRYFIHLAYNGASYNGWQTQPGLPTVQQTLEEALSTLLRQKIAVVGCGRTDTGVHASDFYAHFDYSGQWTVVSGQLSVVSGQWTVDSGQWTVVSGWRLADY